MSFMEPILLNVMLLRYGVHIHSLFIKYTFYVCTLKIQNSSWSSVNKHRDVTQWLHTSAAAAHLHMCALNPVHILDKPRQKNSVFVSVTPGDTAPRFVPSLFVVLVTWNFVKHSLVDCVEVPSVAPLQQARAFIKSKLYSTRTRSAMPIYVVQLSHHK